MFGRPCLNSWTSHQMFGRGVEKMSKIVFGFSMIAAKASARVKRAKRVELTPNKLNRFIA
jgi:hypothetical protein